MLNFLLLLLLLHQVWSSSPSCLDENGNNVDWFVAIKANNGYDYSYAYSRSKILQKSDYTLDDADNGAISRTIQQTFHDEFTSIYWDDQDPDGNSHNTFGHDKGIISFDKDSGFWLIHSTPRFPDTSSSTYKGYPDYAKTYAQSFMCISLDTSTINDVAHMLRWARPYVFKTRIDEVSLSAAPNINFLINGSALTDPTSNTLKFKSKGGLSYTGYGTTINFNDDVYSYIANTYESDVMAETWMNGINPLPSWCVPDFSYNVKNIRSVSFGGMNWTETQDHSKWAITEAGQVCFGGKNRQQSQMTRQGSIVCFEMSDLWTSLKDGIITVDSCASDKHKNETMILKKI